MDFYIIVSLVVVFGLLVWWLFLAISALRNESQGDERIINPIREDFAETYEEAIGLNPKDPDA